jgi:hypothetical protein
MLISFDNFLKEEKLFVDLFNSVLMFLVKMFIQRLNFSDGFFSTNDHGFGDFFETFEDVFVG